MFGISLTETLVILVVVLIFVGPKQLPALARTLGSLYAELRKATDDLRNTIVTEDLTRDIRKVKKELNDLSNVTPSKIIEHLGIEPHRLLEPEIEKPVATPESLDKKENE